MGRRVMIDQGEYIGCETSVELCLEVFAFDEETEKARAIKESGGPEIQEAIDSCRWNASTGRNNLLSRVVKAALKPGGLKEGGCRRDLQVPGNSLGPPRPSVGQLFSEDFT